MEEIPGLTVKDPGNNPHVKQFIFDDAPNLPWARGHNTTESREKLLAYTLESLGDIVSATVDGKVVQVFLRDSSEATWLTARSKVLGVLQPLVRQPI